MSQPQQPAQEQVGGFLGFIERAGNRIPDITMLFIAAFFITCILSAFLSQFHFGYIHPTTGKEIMVTNMLAPKSLVTLMTKMVSNFAGFPPLGMVIVATLGIGIAQGSGYINTGLKKILSVTPRFLMTPIVIVVGMLSHLAPDSGYMIIIPIAAYLFYASGKHPLAGVAASFAGIAGAFAANYTPSAIDPVIQGFTQMAAQLIDPSYEVNVLCNYFFAFAATFPIILVCWWVTEHVTEPWCRKACLPEDGAMRYAADLSVLLSWWKLLDARRDSRGPRRLAAKAALLLYRRSYRRASARHPALDAAFGTELARLQALEDEKSPSIDRTADAFASLLRDCAAHYDGRERRPEQLLLYHVGRYLYLADALEDLPRDVRAGAYNPLRYRYGADGGTLDPADRAQLLETIDASISMACSAMELLDGRRDRELLSNLIYFGLPAVLHAVAEGTFRKAGNRRKT